MVELESRITDIVSAFCRRRIRRSDALVSSGLIDSFGVVELIHRLEKELAIAIPTDQVQPDDFDDIASIVQTLKRLHLL